MVDGFLGSLTTEQRTLIHLYDNNLPNNQWEAPVSLTQAGISAQLKSAVILAGLNSFGITRISEEILWINLLLDGGKIISANSGSTKDQKSTITICASMSDWNSLGSKGKEDFLGKIAKGKVEIGGDFRQYGRIYHKLIPQILDKKINPYFFDILILHTILTSIFVAIPVMMIDVYTMVVDDFPQFYSSIFILSLVITLPLLGFERKRPFAVRSASIIILSFSLVILYLFFSDNLLISIAALICYIGSFSVLEASIPSALSKNTNLDNRGLTMSLYTSFQFFGTFLGVSMSDNSKTFSFSHLE